MALSLDIPEVQVLINFDAGPRFTWHLRVLVVKPDVCSQWVGCISELEVEVVDLSLRAVMLVGRAAPLPSEGRGQCLQPRLHHRPGEGCRPAGVLCPC